MIAVTHNGDFHADDIFSGAVLKLKFPNIKIIRSRDPDLILNADIVFDVGRIYDEEKNRFDHHQSGGAGKRENDIPFASFGLLWKKYGLDICGSKEAFLNIDNTLVSPVDAIDNGFDISKNLISGVSPYSIQQAFCSFSPNWKEQKDIDSIYAKLVDLAKEILEREIENSKAYIEAKQKVKDIYKDTKDKRLIILDKKYPISILNDFPEVLYTIYQDDEKGDWRLKTIRKRPDQFPPRQGFPKEWLGKQGAELVEATGVNDAVFCHNSHYLVVAKTKEGIMRLAEKALIQ